MLWRQVIDDVLRENDGLATRQQLVSRVPRSILDSHVARERLQRVFPHVYADRRRIVSGDARLRAALVCVGGDVVLSHVTALDVWGVRQSTERVHVTIPSSRRAAGNPSLHVHRSHTLVPAENVVIRGLPVTALARSIVDAWPQLPVRERRPLAIDVVRQRLTTAADLAAALSQRPNVGGHRQLSQAIDLISDGVRSELEAVGVLSVFRHPSLPPSVGQYKMRLPDGSRIELDRVFTDAKLAIELDGGRWHTSPEDRQRDLARDGILASLGWLVLRFSYADVTGREDEVRATVLATYTARMRQLHGS